MKNNSALTVVLVAIIVAAVAFFAGMQFQKMQRGNMASLGRGQFAQRFGGQNGNARFGNGAGRPVMGQVVSVDENGVTVKMNDGSTKIVVIPTSATINKAAAGSKSDIKEGATIAVFGTSNSDGSITAQSVQLNPQTRQLSQQKTSPTP